MENEQKIALSLEQQFRIKAFDEQIKNVSLEQAKVLLSELHRQLLLREAYFKYFVQHSLVVDFSTEID
ncbi:NblA/ycf18 family protein [Lyngbya aestuarii]|uniref:NblA/ycf18 family protein n=1 Tax=Lyngbya aestuarii TaxID=118322 RepID=UPI00403D8695